MKSTNELSIKDYIASKISGVLSINMIQNFLGSLINILGNLIVAVFSITFITFFFLERPETLF